MSNFSSAAKTYVCYDDVNTRLMNIIDNKFRDLALEIGALEYHVPALIDYKTLKKCGYFSSFPQHLTVASYVNPAMYERVVDEGVATCDTVILSDQYFTPAACLHIYPMLEGKSFDSRVITTKARVYRYEDMNFNGETRIWDFTVREIVVIGGRAFVEEKIQYVKDKTVEYANSIMLPTKVVPATDCFYPSKKNIIKQKLQSSNSLKCELTVSINDNDVALSSFNLHDFHFSKPFNFDNDNKIVTGCVGYGLERWIAALNKYNVTI